MFEIQTFSSMKKQNLIFCLLCFNVSICLAQLTVGSAGGGAGDPPIIVPKNGGAGIVPPPIVGDDRLADNHGIARDTSSEEGFFQVGGSGVDGDFMEYPKITFSSMLKEYAYLLASLCLLVFSLYVFYEGNKMYNRRKPKPEREKNNSINALILGFVFFAITIWIFFAVGTNFGLENNYAFWEQIKYKPSELVPGLIFPGILLAGVAFSKMVAVIFSSTAKSTASVRRSAFGTIILAIVSLTADALGLYAFFSNFFRG